MRSFPGYPAFALAVTALCMLTSGASAELEDAVAPYLLRSECSAEQISTTEACAREAIASATSKDTCQNFAELSPCWPRCFCRHAEGYAKLVEAYKPQCEHLPPCGMRPGVKNTDKLKGIMQVKKRHALLRTERHENLHNVKLRMLRAAAQHKAEKHSAYEKVWARVKSREHPEDR